MWIYILLAIILIIVLSFISLFIICKLKFDNSIIRIDEALGQVTELLEKKLVLLQKVNKAVKKKTKEDFIPDVENIKLDELDVFQINSEITKYDTDITELIDYNREEKVDSKDFKLLDELNKVNIDCAAVIKYYNENVLKYNDLLHSFPYSMTAKLRHHKEKKIFENQKEEIFEILKK